MTKILGWKFSIAMFKWFPLIIDDKEKGMRKQKFPWDSNRFTTSQLPYSTHVAREEIKFEEIFFVSTRINFSSPNTFWYHIGAVWILFSSHTFHSRCCSVSIAVWGKMKMPLYKISTSHTYKRPCWIFLYIFKFFSPLANKKKLVD